MIEVKIKGLDEKETVRRTLVKSVLYRIFMVLSDFGIVYLLSGEFKISISFAIVNSIFNTLAYFGYDCIWDSIKWGKIIYKKEAEM